ncbi:GntR family transcriptional regulator [Lacticaseibacillus zhaodongensis]|uniref:GntR family transcriptional regulator n=1 Tax=Lacticaseibacillus zhaodongensis TaxID=2668065 RepID=UPI0012D2F443|nr:GntR family transcriptional regulator [Lacticaseibacillus zhaodongensis]
MYHDIAEQIIELINKGVFTRKLPTEAELMRRYSVSRNTIRRAIDLVYQRGLIRRVQGSGYFINDLPNQSKAIVNLSVGPGETMHGGDYHLSSKVVTFDKIIADATLAARMRVDTGSELYRIVRLRDLDGERYCLEEAYYLTTIAPVITVEAANHSIFDFLAESYGIRVSSCENYIGMTTLSPDQAVVLQEKSKQQFLTLTQLNYYGNNQVFNYSTTIFVYPDLRFYFLSSHLQSN